MKRNTIKMNVKAVVTFMAIALVLVALIFGLSHCGIVTDDHNPSTDPTACQHVFGEDVTEVVGQDATCTTITHKCTLCDFEEVVETKEHKYTCNEPAPVYNEEKAIGYQIKYTCSVCEYNYSAWLTDEQILEYELPTIDELNQAHIWSSTEIAATEDDYRIYLDNNGMTFEPLGDNAVALYFRIEYQCSHCNATKYEVVRRVEIIDDTTPEPNPGDETCEHTYTDTVIAPTCYSNGYTQHVCNKCGNSYSDTEVEAKGHTMGDWLEQNTPTCTDIGSEKRVCVDCGHFETREIPALGHKHVTTVVHPSCTEQGYTSHTCVCGDSYNDNYIEATGHNWDAGTIVKEATEDTEGLRKYACTKCNETKTEVIPTANHVHKYTAIVTKPTCTAKGYTTHSCRCGDSYIDSEVKATGHTMGSWTITKEASCGVSGQQTRKCKNCSHTETQTIAAKTHSYGKWTVTTKATCDKPGVETRTCTICSKQESRSIAALGHTYGSWKVTTQATCDKNGVETRTCSGCSKAETRSISSTGHSYGSWKVTKAAGCVTAGTETKTCSKCSGTQTRSIEPTGHAYGSWSTTKKATCSTNGTQSRTCSKCAKVETKSIAATGHKWDNGKITVTPTTCDDIGVKTYTCTVCSTTKTERITGSHSYGAWQWEEYEWEEVAYSPLGNPYPNPDQYKGHRQVRTCTKCSYKDYNTGSKHAHYVYITYGNRGWCRTDVYTETLLVKSTCSTKEKIQYKCTTCGYTIIEESEYFGSHDFTETCKDIKASACTFEFSVCKQVCKICGHVNYEASSTWYDDERELINYKKRYSFYEHGPKWSDFFTDYGKEILFNHPYGWTIEDHVVDSEGYLIQYTMHAHDPKTGKCIKRVMTEQEIYDLVMNSDYDAIYKEKWVKGKAYIYINYALEEDEHGNKWLRPYIYQLVA